MKANCCFLIFTADDSNFWSRQIQRITGSRWSHVALGFELDSGDMVYFECLLEKGFQGPKMFSKLLSWSQQSAAHRYSCVCVDLPPEICNLKLTIANAWVGHVGYSAWQILLDWYFLRIGRFIGFQVPDSPRKMVCSEAVARILQPEIDLRDPIHNTWDSTTPGSIWDRLLEINQLAKANQFFARLVPQPNSPPRRGGAPRAGVGKCQEAQP
jgi:hypothetical protein